MISKGTVPAALLHAVGAIILTAALILLLLGGQTKAQNLQEVGNFVQNAAAEAKAGFKCYQTPPFVYAKVTDPKQNLAFAIRLGNGISGLKTVCAKGLVNAIRVKQGINGGFAKISMLNWHPDNGKYIFGYTIALNMRDGEPNGFVYGPFRDIIVENFAP